MEYLLFAFLALLSSSLNTIFNRLASHKVNSVLSATLKSFFMVIATIIITTMFGHLNDLANFSSRQLIFLIVTVVLTTVNWIFYFIAMKHSHLEAFSPFEQTILLLLGNILFIFPPFFTISTNGGKTLNIALYFLGILFLLVAVMIATFNKRINPNAKKYWMIFAFISALSLAVTNYLVKLELSNIPSDVIAFYQMSGVFIISVIFSVISKNIKQIKTINLKTYIFFFIAAICNAFLMIFRYKALSETNAVPSIVNIIISLEFLIVSLSSALFFKAHNKKDIFLLSIFLILGMVLNVLSGLI